MQCIWWKAETRYTDRSVPSFTRTEGGRFIDATISSERTTTPSPSGNMVLHKASETVELASPKPSVKNTVGRVTLLSYR